MSSLIKSLALASLFLPLAASPSDAQIAWDAQSAEALSARLEAGDYGSVTSFLVLEAGEPVYEAYFNGADAASLHDTRSVTKTVTGYAVARAIEAGALSLDSPVADVFPDYADLIAGDARKAEINVADLLTMSSVMECNDWNEFSRGNEERMYLVEDWSHFFWALPIRGFPSWQSPPEDSAYGRAFSYCTAGVQLLGETVARARGEDFTTLVEREIFAPLGIERFEWPRNGQGGVHMGGGLRLTTQALGALGEQRTGGGDIFPTGWSAAAIAPRAEIPNTPGWRYGYLWWLIPYEVDGETYWAAAMTGNGGNRVMVLADFGITLVMTKTDYNTPTMHSDATRLFETEIVARLGR